jgi:tRNA (guanine26-N2/guanine27-N2)-dimethyltransferase
MVQKFNVVDIDPYGAPTELLDSAVQSVQDGGLLMVTATDMAVLCGNHAEACFTKYGSYSLHKDYHHEQALRILLACISTHAARHKRVIEPVLCLSIDFYIRVCVLVRTSAQDSKLAATKLSYVWQSTGCDAWWLQPVGTYQGGKNAKFQVGKGPAVPGPTCPISEGRFHMGGPIWNQPMCSPTAVKEILTDLQVSSFHTLFDGAELLSSMRSSRRFKGGLMNTI